MSSRALVLSVIALSLAGRVFGQGAPNADVPIEINIPAGTLVKALDKLGDQSGIQIMFESGLAQGVKVPAVNGKLSVRAALAQLLVNTGIKVDRVDERTVVLRKVQSSTSNVSPADQMRTALLGGEVRREKAVADSADAADFGRDQVTVEGRRDRPDFSVNADIPRAINDAQPYYIFDRKTIDQAGAANVEDFLKQRLPMNAVAETNGQLSGNNNLGNTSTINLRGVGSDKTLVLVNGRRMAGVNIGGTSDSQPDINGIPLGAVERIEVLPSSASGIYGGSAIGGVVNLILRKDYRGGELRATYDNTVDTHSPRRTVSGNYGFSLEGGRTSVSLAASWSDAQPLRVLDRREIYENNIRKILGHSPGFFYNSVNTIWLGSLPNIAPVSATQSTLTLDNGVVIDSRNTFIAAGTSAATSAAAMYAALSANAGQWNLDLPFTTQPSTGLLRPFGATPETASFRGSARRQVLNAVEVFADYSRYVNKSRSINSPFGGALTVPAASPANPFTTAVLVRFPDASQVALNSESINEVLTVGAIADLPRGWNVSLDYTMATNRFSRLGYGIDGVARAQDLLSGALNPFVDTLLYPLGMEKYGTTGFFNGSNQLQTWAVRGSGPLPALPSGIPIVTAGLERRRAHTPERDTVTDLPITKRESVRSTYFERNSVIDSAYLEVGVPLVRESRLPGVHSLELQMAGRIEAYEVDTGTPTMSTRYNLDPPVITYVAPTLNGQPFFSKAKYSSDNYTAGIKYQPLPAITLRVSRASAFLPPTPTQLLSNPQPSTSTTSVIDPKRGQTGVQVFTLSGGNADLLPQSSTSANVGIIWTPQADFLRGLRVNLEHYKIEQMNFITTLGVQEIVNQEDTYPGRVMRDTSGAITLVDNSSINVYRRETEGWDVSVDYLLRTATGNFSIQAVQSIIQHLKSQYSLYQPQYDAVNFPSDAGAAKYKTNILLGWGRGGWSASWNTRFIGRYRQYGAAGGPLSLRSYNGAAYPAIIQGQGGEYVDSQMYHDLSLGYSFEAVAAREMFSGLGLQLGVRNIFDSAPPLDAFYESTHYLSPYGDMRMRSYWINVTTRF